MRKQLICVIATVMAFSMVGCGGKSNKKADSIKNEYGELVLGDYKNLSAEKNIYTVTEEDIQDEIENLLYDYVEYKDVKRKSKAGDYLTLKFTASIDGTVVADHTKEALETYIGSEDYGTDFDEKITGLTAGSKLDFAITYADDYADESWAGKKVTFAGTVEKVQEEVFPECTDEFVSENLDYKSYKDMQETIKSDLEKENASTSEYEVREELLKKVVDASTIKSYSDELYESCEASIEESYSAYLSLYGCETVQDLYDMMGMTDEDIKKEVLNLVNRSLVVDAMVQKENLSVSESEYNEAVEQYASDFEYESSEELVEEYGEESINSWILEEKVLDLLQKNATITEKEATKTDEAA